MVDVGDDFYILGGMQPDGTVLSLSEKFSEKDSSWKAQTPMLDAMARPIAASMCANLWVVFNTMRINTRRRTLKYATLQCLRPSSMKWEYKSPLPAGMDTTGATVIAHGDRLLLIGGMGKICTTYDSSTNQWSANEPKLELHHPAGLSFVLRDKVVLFGGLSGGFAGPVVRWEDDAEEYDIVSGEMTDCVNVPPLPVVADYQHTAFITMRGLHTAFITMRGLHS